MKLDKVLKTLGPDTVKELEALSHDQLRDRIVQAETAMEQVADELEANATYQSIKESKSAAEQGKKDVDKRQKAIIKFALSVLNSG